MIQELNILKFQSSDIWIIKKFNAKSEEDKLGQFCRAWNISGQRPGGWKFLKYEGSYLELNAWFYRHLGSKKALLASAHSREKQVVKDAFLVQNVKNKFFHQLPWRGIWVV